MSEGAHEHRARVSRHKAVTWVVVSTVMASLAGWFVGRVADQAVQLATDKGPLAADVLIDDFDTDQVIPEAPSHVDEKALGAAANSGNLKTFVLSNRGINTNGLVIEATVYGTRNYPVIVNAIRATHVRCRPPREAWTLLQGEHGGGLPQLMVDLRLHSNHSVSSGRPTHIPHQSQAWRFPRQVSTAEADRFDISPAAPPGEYCQFHLEIAYSAHGDHGAMQLTNNGRAFTVADSRLGGGNVVSVGQAMNIGQ